MNNNLTKKIALMSSVILMLTVKAKAQVDCNLGMIYYTTGSSIMTTDPTQPLVPGVNPVTNSIPQLPGSEGLAVGDNINGPGMSPTFYTTMGSQYWYWDGAAWVNTGHSSGPAAAVNIGAGGGYIYNLIGASGQVWKYDGTGPATLVLTIATFQGGGPYDIVCDCVGNFYILRTTNVQYMNKYDPNGNLLQTWTLNGAPSNGAGGGFAIIGNTVYYNNTSGFLGGPMVGSQVNFSMIAGGGLNPQPTDFGSCPLGGLNAGGNHDTVLYCLGGVPPTMTSSGTAPFTWTVLSGNATLSSTTTQSTTGTSVGNSVVIVTSASICGTATDTFTIINPQATTLPGDTVFNCGLGTTTTINAAGTGPYTWSVLSGPAVINGSGASVTVTTPATSTIIAGSQAICGPVYDTILIRVPTANVDAGANSTLYGCATYAGSLNGSVTNVTPGLTYSYAWTPPGTITGGINTLNPTIVPTSGVTYTLTVTTPANEGGCTWTDTVHIDVQDMTVTADFDTVIRLGCTGDSVLFTPITTNATNFLWDFGNGASSTQQAPLYVYPAQGTYTITFTASNPYCSATVSKQITLDHPLQASFTMTDDSICRGAPITFTNTSIGTPGYIYQWDFGDGTTVDNDPNPTHTYTADGIYNVMLTIQDGIPCTSIMEQKIVVASISVDIVPKDTSVCLVDSMLMTAVVTAPPYFSSFTYAWTPTTLIGDPTAESVNFYMETSGDYIYTVTATGWPMGCVATNTNHIFVEPRPVLINVTPDQVVEYGTKVQLNAEGVRYYVWYPSEPLTDPNISDPVALTVDPSTTFRVIGMNEHGGCRDTAYVKIDLTYTDDFVPSVFTPNGDGKNDIFRIMGIKYQKVVEFRVFSRWGVELFSTQDGTKGWDGTFKGVPQDVGVYGYLIRVTLPDGTLRTYKGDVTLMR